MTDLLSLAVCYESCVKELEVFVGEISLRTTNTSRARLHGRLAESALDGRRGGAGLASGTLDEGSDAALGCFGNLVGLVLLGHCRDS